jgi:hypothetical protein
MGSDAMAACWQCYHEEKAMPLAMDVCDHGGKTVCKSVVGDLIPVRPQHGGHLSPRRPVHGQMTRNDLVVRRPTRLMQVWEQNNDRYSWFKNASSSWRRRYCSRHHGWRAWP